MYDSDTLTDLIGDDNIPLVMAVENHFPLEFEAPCPVLVTANARQSKLYRQLGLIDKQTGTLTPLGIWAGYHLRLQHLAAITRHTVEREQALRLFKLLKATGHEDLALTATGGLRKIREARPARTTDQLVALESAMETVLQIAKDQPPYSERAPLRQDER